VKESPRVRILVFTEHPVVAIGFASAVSAARGLVVTACCDRFEQIKDQARSDEPDIILVHLTSQITLSDLSQLRSASLRSQIILWCEGIGEEFAFQAMQLGVRAILPSSTPIDGLLNALRNVHRGVLCFEKELLDKVLYRKRVALSRREGQILTLVAQGLKNKAIGETLGITEGTVKVYLYKLFKKLGLNDRLDMALYAIQHLFAGRPPVESLPRPLFGGISARSSEDPFCPRTLPPRTARTIEWRQIN
jgi:two-component system nitrate/nitrite response regulator NarL